MSSFDHAGMERVHAHHEAATDSGALQPQSECYPLFLAPPELPDVEDQ